MRNKWKSVLKIAVLLIIGGIAFYFWKLTPVTVSVVPANRSLLIMQVFGTGTLEAKTRVAVSPRSTGYLDKLCADQGDLVKIGDTLAVMNSEDLIQQIRVAEAELAVTQASLKRIDAEIASAQANLDYAESMFQRAEQLHKSSAISVAEREKHTESRNVVSAALKQAELRRVEAEISIEKHQAQIAYYQSKLGETILTSPFDALVIRRNREVGATVNPGVSIMDIVALDQIWASVWVDETELASLQVGQKALVVFRSLPNQKFPGILSRVSRETDRETREYRVDVALTEMPDKWAIGQRLEVLIETGRKENVLCVPTKLIQWEGGKSFVLIAENGRIARRDVAIGAQTSERSEILSGVSDNELLILAPAPLRQSIGRRVEVAK